MSKVFKGLSFLDMHYGAKRLLNLATAIGLWTVGNHPDIILGTIPFYTAQYVDVSKSEDELKFRAVKGEFMAHQRGHQGKAVRIDIKLTGPTQYTYLTILQALHFMSDVKDVQYNMGNVGSYGNATDVVMTDVDVYKSKDTTELVDQDDLLKKGDDVYYCRNEINHTFNIILKNEILFDMYIETMVYSRDVKNGMNVLEVTLLCRTFPKADILVGVGDIYKQNDTLTNTVTADSDGRKIALDHGPNGNMGPALVVQGYTPKIMVNKMKIRPDNYQGVDMAINAAYRGFMNVMYMDRKNTQNSNRLQSTINSITKSSPNITSVDLVGSNNSAQTKYPIDYIFVYSVNSSNKYAITNDYKSIYKSIVTINKENDYEIRCNGLFTIMYAALTKGLNIDGFTYTLKGIDKFCIRIKKDKYYHLYVDCGAFYLSIWEINNV